MTIIQVIAVLVSLLLIFGWCEYTRVDELARAKAIVKKLNSVRDIIKSLELIFNLDDRNTIIILKKLKAIRDILLELHNDINPMTDNKLLVSILITDRLIMIDKLITKVSLLIIVQKNYTVNDDDLKAMCIARMSSLSKTIIEGLDILAHINMVMYIVYDFTSDYKQERMNDVL